MKNLLLSMLSVGIVGALAVAVNTVAPVPVEKEISELPKVGTVENLEKLIEEREKDIRFYANGISDMAMAEVSEKSAVSVSPGASSDSTGHSETNVQVEGVDEADIVKTDGKYIYHVSDRKIVITEAYPAKDMKVVKEISYISEDGDYFNPYELYIDDEYMIVIGTGYTRPKIDEKYSKSFYYYNFPTYTRAMVYKLNDYSLERTVEVEGNYLSSRKVGDAIYLLANKYIYTYNIEDSEVLIPQYRDTVKSSEYKKVNVADIYYFPNFEECNYLMVAGFKVNNKKEAQISTYLGAGSEIYADEDSLYVTQPKYNRDIGIMPLVENAVENIVGVEPKEEEIKTAIFKFSIDNGEVTYEAGGEVKGIAINQFAMDEYKGYFRIATTSGMSWNETSKNNLYILDDDMNIVGKVEGLAKGEQIYSVRYMGDKAYMVTYRNVDPLFVIDVADPKAPKVLGQLKIPGYSSYLHPYKENYLIGFGKDTVVKGYIDWEGKTQETAYEVGMKLALFDISDFNNPKEVYSIRVGDRGSYSDLLYNHKSLLFNEETGMFAFPATITKSTGNDSSGIPEYGKTIFNGALVYNIDENKGITLEGKISHDTENNKSEYYDYYSNRIQRILYIDDVLYTVSLNTIKANEIDSFEEINKVMYNK